MTARTLTEDALAALRALLEEDAARAADENVLVARDEQHALHPFLRRIADQLRAEDGPGTRVRVEALVARAMAAAEAAWDRHNPPDRPSDHRWLALDEIDAIEADDPDLGELTRRARERALPSDPAFDRAAALDAARDWFSVDTAEGPRTRGRGLPEGRRVDAREGMADREGVPEALRAAFDFYYRVERRDIGGVRLDRGRIGGFELYTLTTTTDGDDAYVEVWSTEPALLGAARFYAYQAPVWDDFPGRVRLSPLFIEFDHPRDEGGFSEPDERAAAGQVPHGWPGEVRLDAGRLWHAGGRFPGALELDELLLTEEWRELAVAAFEFLWFRHLQHAANGTEPVELGPDHQGVLTLGAYTRPDDGVTYQVADWADIDDGSWVLYFQRGPFGLTLAISQFDN